MTIPLATVLLFILTAAVALGWSPSRPVLSLETAQTDPR